MAKLTLPTVSSGYQSATRINANQDLIEAAIENTLSRDGTTPNAMGANLDLNGYDLLNGGEITADSIVLGGTSISATVGSLTTAQTAKIGYDARSVDNATAAAALTDGTIIYMAGIPYEVDSTATGTSSATNDLSVDGLKPFPYPTSAHFGIDTGNSAADNGSAFAAFATYVGLSGNRYCKVLPGTYSTDSGMDFASNRLMIDMAGVTLNVSATNDVIIDLNSNALADESVITTGIHLRGPLYIKHTVDYATTPNTTIGVRARGLVNTVIEFVRCEDLHRGFSLNPRDALTLEKCHGYQNDIHVYVEEWITGGNANPQNLWFRGNSFSAHYTAGYKFEGVTNMVHIVDGYTIGVPGISVENGVSTANSTVLTIEGCDFEQGELVTLTGSWTLSTGSATITAPGTDGAATSELVAGDRIETAGGNVYTVSSITDDDTIVLTSNPTANESTVTIYQAVPYIDVRDTNNKSLFNLVISECKFSGFTGVTSTAHIVHCRDVTGFSFINNNVAARAPGWLWFDSDCTEIDIGRYAKASTNNLIHYDCDRSEIRFWPYEVDLDTDYGAASGSLIEQQTAVSTGDSATEDMSAGISSAYYPTDIVPKGYTFAIAARDSGSASGTAALRILPDSGTSTATGERYLGVELDGHGDNAQLSCQGYVPCDSNGDVYKSYVATGVDTLDVWIILKKIHL